MIKSDFCMKIDGQCHIADQNLCYFVETLSVLLSHWSPVYSQHKGPVMRSIDASSFVVVLNNLWPNNQVAGDLRRFQVHVMSL